MIFEDLDEKDDYVTEWINEWINDKAVCRTARATPGLFKIVNVNINHFAEVNNQKW